MTKLAIIIIIRTDCYDFKGGILMIDNNKKRQGDKNSQADLISEQGKSITYLEFVKNFEKSAGKCEYIGGKIFTADKNSVSEMKIAQAIYCRIKPWFKKRNCQVLFSPVDITLFTEKNMINVVQPAIFVYVNRKFFLSKKKRSGLVVEILSRPDDKKRIYRKMDLYNEVGVGELWLVVPGDKEIMLLALSGNNFREMKTYRENDILSSDVFSGLRLKLREIFI